MIIIFGDPGIEVGLQLVDPPVNFLSECDPIELVQDGAVKALADAVIRHDDFGARVSAAFLRKRVMVSPSGTRAPGAQRCGQAADRSWAASPSSLHGRPLRLVRMPLRARISRCRVPRELPFGRSMNGGYGHARIIALDIHRAFAEAMAWKDGKLSRLGRVIMRRGRNLPSNYRTATLSSSKRPATRLRLPQ